MKQDWQQDDTPYVFAHRHGRLTVYGRNQKHAQKRANILGNGLTMVPLVKDRSGKLVQERK